MVAKFDFPTDCIEQVCRWIEDEDLSMKDIAQRIGCATSTYQSWLQADPVRSARVRAATKSAAETCMRRELIVIDECDDNAPPAAVAKMREKVAHWRRRAAIRDPAFSERFVIDQRVTVDPDSMSDADLLAIAIKAGMSGPVIDGFCQVVEQRHIATDDGAE